MGFIVSKHFDIVLAIGSTSRIKSPTRHSPFTIVRPSGSDALCEKRCFEQLAVNLSAQAGTWTARLPPSRFEQLNASGFNFPEE
tara:strand:- start:819 stop:1070 length:252 start_codon:yes stop_codon:yes gene_type:complete